MRDPRRAGIASGNNRYRAQQQNHGRAFRRIVVSGYEPEFTAPALIDLLARYCKDCGLAREDGACVYPLELHCGLLWAGRLEHELQERIGSEAVRKPFRDVSAFALSPEWEFLYLAVHAARHGWLSLKWFIDLDRLCSAGRVDWEKVKREAKLLGCERALRASLAVCASLLDTPVPPTLMSTGPLQLAKHRASVPRPSDFQVESEILFHLFLLQTPGGKLRYLAARLFVPTPADCRFLRLAPSLFFLYFGFSRLDHRFLLLSPARASKVTPDDGSGQTLDLSLTISSIVESRADYQDYQGTPICRCVSPPSSGLTASPDQQCVLRSDRRPHRFILSSADRRRRRRGPLAKAP